MINKESVSGFVTVCVTVTLCIVVVSMVGVLLYGLFSDGLSKEQKDEIFKALTPSFQTIIGGFIGLITGIKIGHDNGHKRTTK